MAGRIILGIANPALDSNGAVDSGATLTFYQNGTTTPQSVYTDSTLLTPLANPLSCDAAGRFPQVWAAVGTLYSVKWTPTGASPITYDHIAATWDLGGTTTNDTAAAGYFGEFKEVEVLIGAGASVASNTATNIASLSLSAGDWEVEGVVSFNPAGGASISGVEGWISSTSATAPTVPNKGGMFLLGGGLAIGSAISLPTGSKRFSLAATTTVYLESLVVFSGGTVTLYGYLRARRAR